MNLNVPDISNLEWEDTLGTVKELRSGMIHLVGVLSESSTGESMQTTMLNESDINFVPSSTSESHRCIVSTTAASGAGSGQLTDIRLMDYQNPTNSKSMLVEQMDSFELEQKLYLTKEAIALATVDLSSTTDQIKNISTHISNTTMQSNLDIQSEIEILRNKFEQDMTKKLFKMASVIQSGLFNEIRSLDIQPLEQGLFDLIANYEQLVCQNAEISGKYENLLLSKQSPPNLQALLNQTSVFEILERETANSVKEVEELRANHEAELTRLQKGWEIERKQLVAELDSYKARISSLRKISDEQDRKICALSTDYSLLQKNIDSCANYLANSSDDTKQSSVERLKSFFNQLDACCPWIWDSVEQCTKSPTTMYISNPNTLIAVHEKKISDLTLERNNLEVEIRKQTGELRETCRQLSSELESKQQQINQLLDESRALKQRVSDQRNTIKRLFDPNTAEAFLNMLRSRHLSNRSDSSTPGSCNTSNSQMETGRQPIHSLDSQNSQTCVTTLPMSNISDHSMTMNMSSTRIEVPVTTQSPSVLSRVGAAVSAIASAVISPKRRLSVESESTIKGPKSLINSPIHTNLVQSNPCVESIKNKPIAPNEEPSGKRIRTSSNPSENSVPPPTEPFSGFAMPKPLKLAPKRKPLGEIPVSPPERPDSSAGAKKQMSDLDFAFLVNGPLAESTTVLPQNLFNRQNENKPLDQGTGGTLPPAIATHPETAPSPIVGRPKPSKSINHPIIPSSQDDGTSLRPLVPSQLINRQALKPRPILLPQQEVPTSAAASSAAAGATTTVGYPSGPLSRPPVTRFAQPKQREYSQPVKKPASDVPQECIPS